MNQNVKICECVAPTIVRPQQCGYTWLSYSVRFDLSSRLFLLFRYQTNNVQ